MNHGFEFQTLEVVKITISMSASFKADASVIQYTRKRIKSTKKVAIFIWIVNQSELKRQCSIPEIFSADNICLAGGLWYSVSKCYTSHVISIMSRLSRVTRDSSPWQPRDEADGGVEAEAGAHAHEHGLVAGGGGQQGGPQHAALAWDEARGDKIRLIGNVVQSQRRPLLGPSPGWKRLLPLSHLRHY